MRVMAPITGERISPVLDVAKRFVLMDFKNEREVVGREVRIEPMNPAARVKAIVTHRPDVLICGAVSKLLESMLVSAGIQVIFNTCGPVDEVLATFITGELTDKALLMPGCTGRRRRFQRRRGRDNKRGGPR
jgi:predicted Fe-Mo cluster-binding NifX family protein